MKKNKKILSMMLLGLVVVLLVGFVFEQGYLRKDEMFESAYLGTTKGN